jgi:hypothetical protein
MKKKILGIVLVCFCFLFFVCESFGYQQQEDSSTKAINPTIYYWTDGQRIAGFSEYGNFIYYENPPGLEHNYAENKHEGYSLCYTQMDGPPICVYHLYNKESSNIDGMNPDLLFMSRTLESGPEGGLTPETATFLAPGTKVKVKVVVRTIDGVIALRNFFVFQAGWNRPYVKTVIRNRLDVPIYDVVLKRHKDLDVDTGGTCGYAGHENNFGKTSNSVFAWNDPAQRDRFADDVEGGVGGWTASGLWHIEDDSDNCGNSYTPSHSWYYGQYDPDLGECNYNTGSTNKGDLISPKISIGSCPAVLTFNSWEETELSYYDGTVSKAAEGREGPKGPFDYDRRLVYISDDDGATWTLLHECEDNTPGWYQVGPIDLSLYKNATVQLKFTFDSVDGLYNQYRGWYVDDIKVSEAATAHMELMKGYPMPTKTAIILWDSTNYNTPKTLDILSTHGCDQLYHVFWDYLGCLHWEIGQLNGKTEKTRWTYYWVDSELAPFQ